VPRLRQYDANKTSASEVERAAATAEPLRQSGRKFCTGGPATENALRLNAAERRAIPDIGGGWLI